MDSITIRIKPTLITSALQTVMARYQDGIRNEQDRANAYFAIMESIEKLESRLLKYFRIIKEAFMDRSWTRQVLEDVGEKILNYAYENASSGYTGLPKGKKPSGESEAPYKKRENVVEELYRLRFGTVPEGLTTGEDQLLNSLEIGDQHNIYNVKADNSSLGSVEVGTKWLHARLLEEGGFHRTRDYENHAWHLGLANTHESTAANPIPAKWLVEAVGADEAREIAYELVDLINQQKYFPPRPYLKPALWYVRFGKEYISMLIDIVLVTIKRDIGQLSGFGLQGDTFQYEWSQH